MIVLDTSAWLKRIKRDERHVHRVDRIIEAHLRGDATVYIPYVAWAEAVDVLWRKWRQPWPVVRASVQQLSRDRLRVIPCSRRLLVTAADLGHTCHLKNPDAQFAAAALLRRCRLVTDDAGLCNRLRRAGFSWAYELRNYAV